jgi:phage virion morphogenesis protein
MQPIEINMKYLEKIQKLMTLMVDRGQNLRPLMRQVAADMHNAVEENFEQQGRPGWKALNTAYAKYKAKKKKKGDLKILEYRGDLRRTITEKSDATQAVVGSNLDYAPIHQHGGTINIPARTNILHFKKYKSGKRKGKTLFAKNNTKASYGMKSAIGAYKVEIKARPFLKFTDSDMGGIMRRFTAYYLSPRLNNFIDYLSTK